MVSVTKRAAEVMCATLAQQAGSEPGRTLRLVMTSEGGFRLRVDKEREGDKVVKVEREKVLVMASDAAEALSGAVIDAQDTGEGPKLTIRR